MDIASWGLGERHARLMATSPRRQFRIDPTVPFTRAEARAAGIPLATLLGPRFQKVFYDLYVDSAIDVTAAVRAKAALKLCVEGSFVSHFTAAELWSGVVPQHPLTHVTARPGSRPERRGIKCHVARGDERTTAFRGLLLTTPEQTFVDLARHLSLVELVVLGDSLVRKHRTTPDLLAEAAGRFRGRAARLARRAAALVREGVDSAMESRLRMLLVLAGLPDPCVNFTMRDDDGAVTMRFDLSYPKLKLIIEYDGRQHARDGVQWGRDIARREALDRLGWRLIVVRSEDLYDRPDQTLQRVVEALHDRGATVPRRLAVEWRQHFPVRRNAA